MKCLILIHDPTKCLTTLFVCANVCVKRARFGALARRHRCSVCVYASTDYEIWRMRSSASIDAFHSPHRLYVKSIVGQMFIERCHLQQSNYRIINILAYFFFVFSIPRAEMLASHFARIIIVCITNIWIVLQIKGNNCADGHLRERTHSWGDRGWVRAEKCAHVTADVVTGDDIYISNQSDAEWYMSWDTVCEQML